MAKRPIINPSPVSTDAGKSAKSGARKAGKATKEGVKTAAKAVGKGIYTAADVTQGAMEGFSEGIGYTGLGGRAFDYAAQDTLKNLATADPLYEQWEAKNALRRQGKASARYRDEKERLAAKEEKGNNRQFRLSKDRLKRGREYLSDPRLREEYDRYQELLANADVNALEAFHERGEGFSLRPDEIEAMRGAEEADSYIGDLKRREAEVNAQTSAIADLIDAQELDTEDIARKSLSETGKDPKIVAAEKKRKQDEARLEKQGEEMLRPSGLSSEQIQDYARQKKNARLEAQKSGAFAEVDRREKERGLRYARADRLAKDAQELGYKNVTRESVLASLSKRFRGMEGGPSHDDMMSMMSTMRNDMYRNANKKFMAERGAAMNRADAQAASRAGQAWQTLDKGLSAPGSKMSESQIAAKARWDAKREANSANYHKGAANAQYQGYMTGPQYGRDVYTEMQKQWGPNGRTMLTPGSAGHNYAQALDFNRQMQEAQIRSVNTQAQLAQNQTGLINGLTTGVNNTKPGGTPTQSDINAVATTPMTPEPNKEQTI